jgi:hypothetical protein
MNLPVRPPLLTTLRAAGTGLRKALPGRRGDAIAQRAEQPFAMDAAQFDAPLCRNCGADLAAAYCGACGQKRAGRFSHGDVGKEVWENWRLFEMELVTAIWRLITGPGRVAREYVLGARKRQMHPLKLLLVAVGLLLLMLSTTNYLSSGNAQVSRAMELVQAWGKWSFSLNILAILGASLTVFRRRLHYNVIEHLVLAAYVQTVLIACNLLNLLPVLVWDTPDFIAAHKAASKYYMYVIEAGVVALSFRQFFLVCVSRESWRREAWRLLLAAAVFVALNWLLLRLYGRMVVKIVLAQLS